MAFVEFDRVSKSFGQGPLSVPVLKDVNLSIADGEFVAIVGFSGTGKSTLINLLAGLLTPDKGQITLAGAPLAGPGPDRGVVFQSYALLPWLTVEENVALAVDATFKGKPKTERRAQVHRFVDMVGLTPARKKRPKELSGGMRQRVAVARALAMDPRILLLDEPLAALDALTRATLQDEIERIWRAERKTVVLITNDVDEGLLLADRIIALEPGPPATLGRAFEVPLDRPRDRMKLNRDATYKELRNEILKHLTDVGRHRGAPRMKGQAA